MAKFTVLRPIEHNQVLYVSRGATKSLKAKSAGYGGEIPVDASGTIELDAAAAKALSRGQVAPATSQSTDTQAKPLKR
jgi:hypothetical protein